MPLALLRAERLYNMLDDAAQIAHVQLSGNSVEDIHMYAVMRTNNGLTPCGYMAPLTSVS